MARISMEELLARIGKGKLIPAILLLGDEPYLRDECRAALIEQFIPPASHDWAVTRYSAEQGDTQLALEQAQTLPMLSPQQLVFLANLESVEKFADKKRDDIVKLLEAYLENPAPFTGLVMEAKQLDQRMRLGKMLAEKTLVVDVGLGENPEERLTVATKLTSSMAKEYGATFEKGAAEDLAECVAADLQRMKTEIAKLSTYVGERKLIRREDVSALVVSEKTTTVWELANLLASGKQAQALEFLDRLLRDGEEPLPMLGAITWMYRKLIEASEIKGAVNGWQAARTLSMRPEQAEMALQASRKISKSKLLEGLQALKFADDRLKHGSDDARAVLEFMVTQLIRREAKASP
jgi:DNA polymerase III subunit delta